MRSRSSIPSINGVILKYFKTSKNLSSYEGFAENCTWERKNICECTWDELHGFCEDGFKLAGFFCWRLFAKSKKVNDL